MTIRGVKYLLLSLALALYALIALGVSGSMASNAPCTGVIIDVAEEGGGKFVNAHDINYELDNIVSRADTMIMSHIDLSAMERRLNSLPNVERANCIRTSDDKLLISVEPMQPVARVIDGNRSYYINHEGKRLKATLRYRLNVPLIIGHFGGSLNPAKVIPLIDRVESNEQWSSLVAAYEVTGAGDIILIPTLTGHVINFGDASDPEGKFKRLTSFYKQVMPVKGWNYYDTISVKFSGQIVAQISPSSRIRHTDTFDEEEYDETVIPMDVEIVDPDEDYSTAIPTIN